MRRDRQGRIDKPANPNLRGLTPLNPASFDLGTEHGNLEAERHRVPAHIVGQQLRIAFSRGARSHSRRRSLRYRLSHGNALRGCVAWRTAPSSGFAEVAEVPNTNGDGVVMVLQLET